MDVLVFCLIFCVVGVDDGKVKLIFDRLMVVVIW